MAFYRLTSTKELCQRLTWTTYDGVDYNEHRANVHLSPRGAHWKAFSARYFIPPLAFSVHCINISVHSPCIVLTLDPGLTIIELADPQGALSQEVPTCVISAGVYRHLMLEIGCSKLLKSSLWFEEYICVGTNIHSTEEPVTKVSELNLKLYTAPLW